MSEEIIQQSAEIIFWEIAAITQSDSVRIASALHAAGLLRDPEHQRELDSARALLDATTIALKSARERNSERDMRMQAAGADKALAIVQDDLANQRPTDAYGFVKGYLSGAAIIARADRIEGEKSECEHVWGEPYPTPDSAPAWMPVHDCERCGVTEGA